MATVRKIVRFYEPVMVDNAGATTALKNGFWVDVHNKLPTLAFGEREANHRGVDYAGNAFTGVNPATDYLYVCRLRPVADRPDGYDRTTGDRSTLELKDNDHDIAEPTYLVPFGNKNYVAVMSPTSTGVRSGALNRWLTRVANPGDGLNLELRPLVDPTAADKLAGADGATRLQVRLPAGADLQNPDGTLQSGIADISEGLPDDATVELTISFGHTRPRDGRTTQILQTARWLATMGTPERHRVSLLVPTNDGLRVEAHDLLHDAVVESAEFQVPADETPSEGTILSAINETIVEFRRRMSN